MMPRMRPVLAALLPVKAPLDSAMRASALLPRKYPTGPAIMPGSPSGSPKIKPRIAHTIEAAALPSVTTGREPTGGG
jgi:hypothetical protein